MANNRVCVGGIDLDKLVSVRLMDRDGYHETREDCSYNIREIWDIDYQKYNQRSLPHSEDVIVLSKVKLRNLKEDSKMTEVLKYVQYPVFEGSLLNVFEGQLQHTDNGALYISKNTALQYSTCFWICDRELRRKWNAKPRYYYNDETLVYTISYVGLEETSVQIIPKDSLVRLSLAHWWSPNNSEDEERCYLQLSGWY
jgi:hypothetical protein